MVEGDKVPSSSIGIDAMGPDTANEGGKSDAPELGAGNGLKRRKKSKKHHSTNVNEFSWAAVNEANNLKKDFTNSGHENIVHGDHKIEASRRDETDGRNELPQNCDPKTMLSEKCEHQVMGEADVHSKAVSSAKLDETITGVEFGKSGGHKRMNKKPKHQPSLDCHHVTVSETSNKKMGEVVNSSQHQKSLLATPGAIFKDWTSESSKDESGSENSDSGTKTPSDNSSSSDYSEGETSSLETPRHGNSKSLFGFIFSCNRDVSIC
ncbi:uncharacterized protein LOC130791764 isoform X1 [Actinidia eriantha]|uniref:uncharacterized protein LOC130791764 isoform X1 n=1 Tax=Actinidia eriantha TaxID=165200 RepID=UPI00258F3ED6|nr:uncharacterized protein LOC130791764 isoform X1 [Actinidia eriantha]